MGMFSKEPVVQHAKLMVYSVYDQAMKGFMNPFYQVGRGLAFRMFQDAVNDAKSVFFTHPEDYTLFELGTYDPKDGSFENHKAPEKVVTASEVKSVIPMKREDSIDRAIRSQEEGKSHGYPPEAV